jgi:hypothetical protein
MPSSEVDASNERDARNEPSFRNDVSNAGSRPEPEAELGAKTKQTVRKLGLAGFPDAGSASTSSRA